MACSGATPRCQHAERATFTTRRSRIDRRDLTTLRSLDATFFFRETAGVRLCLFSSASSRRMNELSRIRAPRGSMLCVQLNRRRGRSDAQPKASVSPPMTMKWRIRRRSRLPRSSARNSRSVALRGAIEAHLLDASRVPLHLAAIGVLAADVARTSVARVDEGLPRGAHVVLALLVGRRVGRGRRLRGGLRR